ncbi:MAG: hypothetical protein K2N14_03050 [Clostridia bacterium]|nr:hypothetical protein [Clostridia bacterium]
MNDGIKTINATIIPSEPKKAQRIITYKAKNTVLKNSNGYAKNFNLVK